MPVKITIAIPEESLETSELLEPLVSDIGDSLVAHGYGNLVTAENATEMSVDSLKSYIFITEDSVDLSENLEGMLFVIPVKEEE